MACLAHGMRIDTQGKFPDLAVTFWANFNLKMCVRRARSQLHIFVRTKA